MAASTSWSLNVAKLSGDILHLCWASVLFQRFGQLGELLAEVTALGAGQSSHRDPSVPYAHPHTAAADLEGEQQAEDRGAGGDQGRETARVVGGLEGDPFLDAGVFDLSGAFGQVDGFADGQRLGRGGHLAEGLEVLVGAQVVHRLGGSRVET